MALSVIRRASVEPDRHGRSSRRKRPSGPQSTPQIARERKGAKPRGFSLRPASRLARLQCRDRKLLRTFRALGNLTPAQIDSVWGRA